MARTPRHTRETTSRCCWEAKPPNWYWTRARNGPTRPNSPYDITARPKALTLRQVGQDALVQRTPDT